MIADIRGACARTAATCTPADRAWICDGCGVVHDRDGNASLNLNNFAARSAVTACGAVSSGLGLATRQKLTAVKQEPTHGIFVHV
jgi:transposase